MYTNCRSMHNKLFHMYTYCRSILSNCPYVHLMSFHTYTHCVPYAHSMCSICTLNVDQYNKLAICIHMYTQCTLTVDQYNKLSICTLKLNVSINTTNVSICILTVDHMYNKLFHMYTYCRSIQQIVPYVHLMFSINTTNCSICTLNFRYVQLNCPYVHLLSINTTNCSICTLMCRSIQQIVPYVHSMCSICTTMISMCTLNVFHMYNSMCSMCTLNAVQYNKLSICVRTLVPCVVQYNKLCVPYVHLLSINTTNCPYVHLMSINTTNCSYVY